MMAFLRDLFTNKKRLKSYNKSLYFFEENISLQKEVFELAKRSSNKYISIFNVGLYSSETSKVLKLKK